MFIFVAPNLVCTNNIDSRGLFSGDMCEPSLQPDIVNLTCSIKFTGNIPPQLNWTRDGTEDVLNASTISILNNSKLSSSIIVQAAPRLNGSKFICKIGGDVSLDGVSSTGTIRSWMSPQILVIGAR